MRIFLTLSIQVLALLLLSTSLRAQTDVPHFCKTDAGVLGPYPNDGTLKVGGKCYGTDQQGQRHVGTAVLSRNDNDAAGGGSAESGAKSGKIGVPHYCQTDAGVLGPYPNDQSLSVGDPCYGTDSNGQRHDGTLVMIQIGDGSGGGRPKISKKDLPQYCKTDAGVLGPFPNEGSVKVGDKCYGTDDDGNRHEGKAVMSKNGNDAAPVNDAKPTDAKATDAKQTKTAAPYYCRTDVGILGPYPNEAKLKFGDPCRAVDKDGYTHTGMTVMSKGGNDK